MGDKMGSRIFLMHVLRENVEWFGIATHQWKIIEGSHYVRVKRERNFENNKFSVVKIESSNV